MLVSFSVVEKDLTGAIKLPGLMEKNRFSHGVNTGFVKSTVRSCLSISILRIDLQPGGLDREILTDSKFDMYSIAYLLNHGLVSYIYLYGFKKSRW